VNSEQDIELVVLVDDDNNVIGTANKREVHHSQTPLHRGFSVFIFDHNGRMLLQQRAFSKQTWPGVWSNSCCGHPAPGESVEAAAARRLEFELGLSGIGLTCVLPDFRYRAEKDGVVENEICPVLIGFTDREANPNPAEVATVRWTDWSELVESLTGSGLSPWAIGEIRELLKSDVFAREFADRVRRHN